MISVLMPTRKRPDNLQRAVHSIRDNSTNFVEIISYIDDDDKESLTRAMQIGIRYFVGPRIIMSDMWNALIPHAAGEILMLAGDDCIFKTVGWDVMVEDAFAACPDKILLVYGDDGAPRGKLFATHPLVHRRWFDILGHFSAPGFSADYADTWPQDLADMIGRKKYLPFETEHLHPVWGKAVYDETYKETNARLHRDNTPKLYEDRLPERLEDAKKLRAAMVHV